jgi:protein O-mannosyl-transferase
MQSASRHSIVLRFTLVAILLVGATVAAYWPVTGHPFLAYDDDFYVANNPQVAGGLSWQAAKWAFGTFHEANWHPLTWLSHQLDVTLFGLRAGAHHLTNVLFHGVNILLLFLLLLRLTGAFWRAACVAALFALHPLHVESVAWVAERKDLLCAFFVLLTLLVYQHYVCKKSRSSYALALLLFACALLAKPMAVTLPFLLLLLDYWPLARTERQGTNPRLLVAEKLPFLVLALASTVVTVIAQRAGGAVISLVKVGAGQRLANAAVSAIAYLLKTAWPADLAPLYPFTLHLPPWKVWVATILLAAMVGFALRQRRRLYCAFGLFWYLGMLVPVSGLVQVGQQGMADRYTYLPLVGIFIVLVWGANDLLSGWRCRQELLGTIALGVVLLCGMAARHQVGYWRSSETLFRHTLAVTTDNYVMHHNLAVLLENEGRIGEALQEHEEALALRPTRAESHYFLANALLRQGLTGEAVARYRLALQINPDYADAHNNMGAALSLYGQRAEAIAHYREALRLNPADDKARANLKSMLDEG